MAAIEAVKGAAMTYQGSVSTAETREAARPKVEATEITNTSESIAKDTTSIDTKQLSGEDAEGSGQQAAGQQAASQTQDQQQASQTAMKNAVDEINRRAKNSEAIFGIHEKTNRVTIKIVDKDTREVIREYPPEKTLDMIAKVWEMAGIMVDEKR
ncbi:MAG: flagellar protein FlaG [Clostridiales bacterium]|nr:flagellar protein FlaG [Clostridiales bacterium]